MYINQEQALISNHFINQPQACGITLLQIRLSKMKRQSNLRHIVKKFIQDTVQGKRRRGDTQIASVLCIGGGNKMEEEKEKAPKQLDTGCQERRDRKPMTFLGKGKTLLLRIDKLGREHGHALSPTSAKRIWLGLKGLIYIQVKTDRLTFSHQENDEISAKLA